MTDSPTPDDSPPTAINIGELVADVDRLATVILDHYPEAIGAGGDPAGESAPAVGARLLVELEAERIERPDVEVARQRIQAVLRARYPDDTTIVDRLLEAVGIKPADPAQLEQLDASRPTPGVTGL